MEKDRPAIQRRCVILPVHMETPQITAYLKTYCGWSAGVRAVLDKYQLKYTEKDIIQNPAFRWEMETKSGQPLSPCVEINETMLSDVSGEDVEKFLIDNKIVQPSDAATDVPTNAACATEQHESNVQLNL
jgi:glutaredoxin